ncbi:hypothetical protein diail_6088, partial [Diaporthe ilicicola]
MASAPSSKRPKDGALSHLTRFKLDPDSTEKTLKPKVLVDVDGELPRIHAGYETKPYKQNDAPVGGALNSLAKANVEDGTYEYWSAGEDAALGEVAFVAKFKDTPEGDGYALLAVNRRDTMLSQVVVVVTAKMAEGPVAIIELLFRLRSGTHGTWVMADKLAADKDLETLELHRGPESDPGDKIPDVVTSQRKRIQTVQMRTLGSGSGAGQTHNKRDIVWVECKAPNLGKAQNWNQLMGQIIDRLMVAHGTPATQPDGLGQRKVYFILATGLKWM